MSHPPRPPVGDVLDGLVASVEQETAKLGNGSGGTQISRTATSTACGRPASCDPSTKPNLALKIHQLADIAEFPF